jgi:Cytochrome oxidase complex assembly protein 1
VDKKGTSRLLWIVIFAVVALIALICAGAAALFFGIMRVVDNTDAHRCALAIVQHDPAAIRMLGSPIAQKGFTGGSTNSENGKETTDLTFTVSGPLGDATVEAKGTKSQLESQFEVLLGRDQQSQTIYSGPLDCPALHEGPSK